MAFDYVKQVEQQEVKDFADNIDSCLVWQQVVLADQKP